MNMHTHQCLRWTLKEWGPRDPILLKKWGPFDASGVTANSERSKAPSCESPCGMTVYMYYVLAMGHVHVHILWTSMHVKLMQNYNRRLLPNTY